MTVKVFVEFRNGQWLTKEITEYRPSIAFITRAVCDTTLQKEVDIVTILIREIE